MLSSFMIWFSRIYHEPKLGSSHDVIDTLVLD